MRPKWGLMVARYGYSDWDGFKPTPWLWFEPAAKFGERGRIWPPANCASLSWKCARAGAPMNEVNGSARKCPKARAVGPKGVTSPGFWRGRGFCHSPLQNPWQHAEALAKAVGAGF